MQSIYEYIDYRKFICDWLAAKKKENSAYSYRFVAARTGFKSAGHLNLVLKGKVNLSFKYIDSFIRLLGLRRREAEYFQAIVLYAHAKNHEEKKRHFEKMISFKQFRATRVEAERYEFFETWYYTAVLFALDILPFKDDYKTLSKLLTPGISVDEAKKAIEVLHRLGMITRNAQGVWQRVDKFLTTGTDTPTVAVSSFIENTMDLAKQALHQMPRAERNISWATVSVSKEGFEKIQEEIRAMRRQILQIAGEDDAPDRVYHFNINFFPLSKPRKRDGE